MVANTIFRDWLELGLKMILDDWGTTGKDERKGLVKLETFWDKLRGGEKRNPIQIWFEYQLQPPIYLARYLPWKQRETDRKEIDKSIAIRKGGSEGGVNREVTGLREQGISRRNL